MRTAVLVIDDEEDMRVLARFALEQDARFAVSTAASGREGLELARLTRPDVILLDWMMPGMDGPQTLRSLKADAAVSDIPVIFLTGVAHDRSPTDFIALGAHGALAKPFNPMTLASELSALLSASRESAD
jgi:CheY-like chemotaxis protein